MPNHFYSSCPVARRTSETFVEWTSIGGERRRFEFERPVVWLQQSEADVRFVHGGEELKRGSTHNDFYGYLTAAEGLQGSARQVAKTYGVTEESSLVIEIVTRVFLSPVIETEETKQYNLTKPRDQKSQWAYIPEDWRKEVQDGGETIWPRLENVELAEEVVWSTKHSAERNEELLSEFRERWGRSSLASVA